LLSRVPRDFTSRNDRVNRAGKKIASRYKRLLLLFIQREKVQLYGLINGFVTFSGCKA